MIVIIVIFNIISTIFYIGCLIDDDDVIKSIIPYNFVDDLEYDYKFMYYTLIGVNVMAIAILGFIILPVTYFYLLILDIIKFVKEKINERT